MRVSGLTPSGDWTFGRGKANYKTRSDAIRQNVLTRIRSFKFDYFADMEAGIDWITIMGIRGNQQKVLREVERTVLQTEGVRKIDRLEIVGKTRNRSVTIQLEFTDLFDETYIDQVVLP